MHTKKPETIAFAILFLVLIGTFILVLFRPTPRPSFIPAPLATVTLEKSFEIAQTRTSSFKDTLQFHIEIPMVVIEPNAENTQGYVLHIQAALINVSDRIIIVRRSLSPAPAIFPDTFLIATYKDQALQVPLCCVDGFRYVDNNYFLPLYPGESKSYSWESYLPRFTENSQGQSVDLAGKTIEVYEGYGNQEIGYAIQDQNTLGYMMSYDSTGQPVFYVADMNMWVGELESNHITFSLPN